MRSNKKLNLLIERPKTARDVLRNAYNVIKDKKAWTQGVAFKAERDRAINADGYHAKNVAMQPGCQMCATGAIMYGAGFNNKLATSARSVLRKVIFKITKNSDLGIVGFNDRLGTKHADVKKAFLRAIFNAPAAK